jgi:dipeptidyl aminopeptidase/acylaminoacyl peptidase
VITRSTDSTRGALLALALLAPGLAAQTRRPATIEDLMRIRTVTDARISPDGSRIAYVVSVPDVGQNQHDTDIWLVGAEGGEPLRLTASPKMDQMPRWSPDGKTIAFLSAREGPPNVYLLPLGGGEPRKLTAATTGVADFAWSPDGSRIAFLSADPASDADQQAEKENGGVMVIDEKYPLGRLRVIDVATKAVTDLTLPDRHVSGLAWSPDGNRIAFVSSPTPKVLDGDRSDLFVVPSRGGAIAPLVVQPGPESSPTWSPDGRSIAFISSSGSSGLGDDHLFVISADGGTPRKIAPSFDNHFSSIAWSPDGKDVFFTTTERVRMQVLKVSVDGGTVTPVTSGDRVYSDYSLSKDGTRMALVVQDPTTPPEVYVTSTTAFQPTRLSRTNPVVDSLALGTTEVVRWKAKDGTEIEGLLLKPVGYQAGRRVPVLTYIHGGPSGVFTLGFGPQLGPAPLPLQAEPYPLQVFAGKGYAVFMPNIRGSSGYGRAFLRSNIKDWGHADFQDVMSGLDYLIAQGIADGDRLGMMGWSYGGYMTSWSITQTDRFKAASVGAGLPDLVSLHGATDIPSALAGNYFGAPPWKAKELYENSSAIFFAQNIKTPTLIQHGEKDDRVQLSQAWELYRALEANDVPRLFVVYPRQGHLILEPKLERDMLQRNLSWFTRWVQERPRT